MKAIERVIYLLTYVFWPQPNLILEFRAINSEKYSPPLRGGVKSSSRPMIVSSILVSSLCLAQQHTPLVIITSIFLELFSLWE